MFFRLSEVPAVCMARRAREMLKQVIRHPQESLRNCANLRTLANNRSYPLSQFRFEHAYRPIDQREVDECGREKERKKDRFAKFVHRKLVTIADSSANNSHV